MKLRARLSSSSGASGGRGREPDGLADGDVLGLLERATALGADGHAVLPEGMTHLPDRAFRNRASLVSVAFPRSLASIGSSTFEGCSSLSSIDLPAGLTAINNYAFFRCSALSSVTLPASLTSIGSCAFRRCAFRARPVGVRGPLAAQHHRQVVPPFRLQPPGEGFRTLLVPKAFVP